MDASWPACSPTSLAKRGGRGTTAGHRFERAAEAGPHNGAFEITQVSSGSYFEAESSQGGAPPVGSPHATNLWCVGIQRSLVARAPGACQAG